MNAWFRDPRTKLGEAKSIEADEAERRGDFGKARSLHREAAEALATVAIGVPADHPNTRSDLAIAAVASFACAGEFGSAVALAQRFLAQSGALSARGRGELALMVDEYSPRPPGRAA